MSQRHFLLPAASAVMLFLAAVTGAQAAGESAANVNVYQFAVDNPVDNAQMRIAPTLGASVPAGVKLVPLEQNNTYAYFYYNGAPVIVDLSTRSVVRIGR